MSKLVEGRDFYINEEGLEVMTARYHLERGFCCGNGCKHCPYHHKEVAEPLKSVLIANRQKGQHNKPET